MQSCSTQSSYCCSLFPFSLENAAFVRICLRLTNMFLILISFLYHSISLNITFLYHSLASMYQCKATNQHGHTIGTCHILSDFSSGICLPFSPGSVLQTRGLPQTVSFFLVSLSLLLGNLWIAPNSSKSLPACCHSTSDCCSNTFDFSPLLLFSLFSLFHFSNFVPLSLPSPCDRLPAVAQLSLNCRPTHTSSQACHCQIGPSCFRSQS